MFVLYGKVSMFKTCLVILAGSDQHPLSDFSLYIYISNLKQFGRVTCNIKHFSFHNIPMIGINSISGCPTWNFKMTGDCDLLLYITLYVEIELLFFWQGFKIWPAPQSIVITYFYRMHHHRFNDSTALPYICHFPSVTFKQLCLDPCFELLSNYCTPSPLMTPSWLLTKTANPLAQISSPWCEALPNEKLLVKTLLLLHLLLRLLVCLWAPVKDAIPSI